MENQTCLVEEYTIQQPSTVGVIVKGIENIKYAEKIKGTANGVYLMKGLREDMIAVFKPIQEEIFYSVGKKKGYKADREVAAFILDHPAQEGGERFGRVPPTSFARARYTNGETTDSESGSLQQYVQNQEWKQRPEVFAIDDVQRLSLIDVRFGNNDRHNGNILNSNTNGGRLIPIDHGECFPKCIMWWNNYSFIWTTWAQAAFPYPYYMVDYVKSLDVKNDLNTLKENGIELGERSEYIYKVQNKVLQAGVLGGYTPKDIGKFMTKVYRRKKEKAPRTIIDVMNCMSGIPEAWSVEESQALELVHEKTTSALDYNRRYVSSL
ncbi:unnamed protein product [Brassica oleracea]